MNKLILAIAISSFSIFITTNCMELSKGKESKTENLSNLSEKDLKDKSVEELNKLLQQVIKEIKRLRKESSESKELALKLLETNPDAQKDYLEKGFGPGSPLHDQLIRLQNRIINMSQIAQFISETIYEKGGTVS